MRRALLSIALLIVLATLAGGALAQGDMESFLKSTAGKLKLEVDKVDGYPTGDGYEWVFEGDVSISQDDWTLTCDRFVLVTKDKPGKRAAQAKKAKRSLASLSLEDLKSARATGNVKIVFKKMMAMSAQATYDALKRTVTLSGGSPKIWQGKDMMQASTIVLHLDDNQVEMGGRETGAGDKKDRVVITINPPSKKEKDNK